MLEMLLHSKPGNADDGIMANVGNAGNMADISIIVVMHVSNVNNAGM